MRTFTYAFVCAAVQALLVVSLMILINSNTILKQQAIIIHNQNMVYIELCRITTLNPIEGVPHGTLKKEDDSE